MATASTGASGLEYEYNPLLAGKPGSEEIEEGTDHEPIPQTELKIQPGHRRPRSLRLTINPYIQYDANQVCQQRVKLVRGGTAPSW